MTEGTDSSPISSSQHQRSNAISGSSAANGLLSNSNNNTASTTFPQTTDHRNVTLNNLCKLIYYHLVTFNL